MSIAVVGAGAWGAALAQGWASAGRDTLLLARNGAAANLASKTRSVPHLPGVELHRTLRIAHDPQSLSDRSVVAIVVPAQAMGGVLTTLVPHLDPAATLVLCCKGIEAASGRTMAEVARAVAPDHAIAVLSGPSFAADVARGKPTAVTLAADDADTALKLAGTLSTPTFRIYASDDVAGVEAGGALKNVLALAVGAARGLRLGASAEAALTTRGFAEIMRLGTAMGGRADTLTGLSGLGDTMLTCASPASRNFAYGVALADGPNPEGLPLAEGVATAAAAQGLARERGIDVPVVDAVCALLEGRMTAAEAVDVLLSRPLKTET